MPQRNLLYTAITRGRRLVVLVGTPKATAIATRRADAAKRYTALRQRLQRTTLGQMNAECGLPVAEPCQVQKGSTT